MSAASVARPRRREGAVAPLLALLALVLAFGALAVAAPAPARADDPASCQAPSGQVAHPGRTRLIYAGCTPVTAVPASVTFDAPDHGQVSALSPLTYQYTADAGYTGPVSFTVHPVGADGQAWPAFTFALTASTTANTAPNCGYGSTGGATREGRPITLTLNPCYDDEGDPITMEIVDGPAHGSLGVLTPRSDGSGATVTYTPDAGFTGTETIGYAAVDDYGGTSRTATIAVQVNPLGQNQPPLCVGPPVFPWGAGVTVARGPTRISLACQDADGDPLSLTFLQPPAHGTAVAEPSVAGQDPAFLYTPQPGYRGNDTVVVRARGPGDGGRAPWGR